MDDEEYDKNDQGTDSQDEDNKESEGQSDDDQEESNRESEELSQQKKGRPGNNEDQIFNEEEIQNLKDIFDLFDKDQSGKIESTDLENIFASLKRDPEEAKEMLSEIDPNHDGEITFQEFIKLMAKIENKIDKKDDEEDQNSSKQGDGSQGGKDRAKRTALIDFLVLLEDYRAKCESEGKYAEARK